MNSLVDKSNFSKKKKGKLISVKKYSKKEKYFLEVALIQS
jgi:hypothetical protein